MIDEFTKESLHIDVAGSIRSKRLIQILEQLIEDRGCPLMLRSDHGPEFVSIALLKWAAEKGLRNLLIEPGKPWQNGTNESFNGKFQCVSNPVLSVCICTAIARFDYAYTKSLHRLAA